MTKDDEALSTIPAGAAPSLILAAMQDYHVGFLDDVAEAMKPNGGEFGAHAFLFGAEEYGLPRSFAVEYQRGGAHLLSIAASEAFRRLGLISTLWPRICECGNVEDDEDDEWAGPPECDGSCEPSIALTDLAREVLRLHAEKEKVI